MIISNSRKYIFVHLHKTAGTAITREFESHAQWNDIVLSGAYRGNVRHEWFDENYGLETHSSAIAIKNVVSDAVWDEYFTFSFVRDPYRRMLSLYTWLDGLISSKKGLRWFERYVFPNKGIWPWPGTKACLESKNFSDFIRHPLMQDGAPGAAKMVDSLFDSGDVLVDFVGKLESLDEDVKYIRSQLGMAHTEVKRTNSTKAKIDPNQYYQSQADLDLVYERYREDFEAFDYQKKQVGEL